MDQLIKVINRLQDAFSAVGVSNPLDLPQIVVVGSQSSGKSSVLENIVGRDFLPRGSGIVTRRPLVLQLINRPATETKKEDLVATDEPSGDAEENPDEWGEFLHKPGVKFFDFNKIREEIIRDTDAKTGKDKGISSLPINLRVYSPHVVTLTLVDLPGLTKVPVGDQPKDIERMIRDMLLVHIRKPNSIILAVTSANTDLANSDGIKLAREVDPEGLRTIGVLTKIDLMDAGTDVVDILAGRVVPLRLGYVPVVNRGQKAIDGKKSIKAALESEKEFFETHPSYQSKSQYCGTPFLTRKLNMILMHHIRTCLPDIKLKISQNIQKYQAELASLGESIGSGDNAILPIITDFCADFRKVLDGTYADISTNELNGGARISFVYHEIFANAINSMDAFDNVKEADIRTLLYNASGSAPALFVATAAFEVLIKQQVKRLEEPSLKCVQMVHDELVRILTQILQKPIFKRFPTLKEKFYSVVIMFYKKGLEPTCNLVSSLNNAECCYINTAHPDFVSGHRAIAMVNEKMNTPKPAETASNVNKKPLPTISPSASLNTNSANEDGFFGSFFNKKAVKRPGVLDPAPAILKASGSVSEREFMEIEVIKILLNSYFSIAKKTTVDMVPKAIMLNLVVYCREKLQEALLEELYKPDAMDELLKESDVTASRRKECQRMIIALQKADEIVSTV